MCGWLCGWVGKGLFKVLKIVLGVLLLCFVVSDLKIWCELVEFCSRDV